MSYGDPTTIGGTYAPPQIRLHVRKSKPRINRDLRAAEGIILAAVTGAAMMAWVVALIRWLF